MRKILPPPKIEFSSRFKTPLSLVEGVWKEHNIYSCYRVSEDELIENWLGNWFQVEDDSITCVKEVDSKLARSFYNQKYNTVDIHLSRIHERDQKLCGVYTALHSLDDAAITLQAYNLTDAQCLDLVQATVDWVDSQWVLTSDSIFEAAKKLGYINTDWN